MPRPKKNNTGRLNLRLPKELVRRMHAYSKRHGIALGDVAAVLFQRLLTEEANAKALQEVQQYDAEQA